MSEHTIVHLVRHGEVDNPEKILYGRLPGYHLSALGREMAEKTGEYLATRDIRLIVASPLERAQETARPLSERTGLPVTTDERLIEAGNTFEGMTFGVGDGSLRHPRHWIRLRNPFRPSWGEPYVVLARRMHAAAQAARDAVPGGEAVLISHQLPVWIARLAAEHRRLWHDPRRRECTLASVTSFHYTDNVLSSVSYAEPAADLLPCAAKVSGA
jgi:broad specificity phosphatase PhoE